MNQIAKIKTEDASPVDTFAEAFVKLQAAIKPAIKDATNPAFRSKYADLGAVWEAVKGPLTDNGFSIIQSPNFEGDSMWLTTTILHISGEKIEGRYPLRPSKPDPQGYGSALTYARRYSISAMLGVIADDDDDGNAASQRPAPKPVQAVPPPQELAPHEPVEDQDVTDGVKNWCEQQKSLIADCKTLPELTDWLDKQGGDLLKPALGSALDRLIRKNKPAFNDLKTFYLARMNKI